MAVISVFQILSIICFSLFLAGILNIYFTVTGNNDCDMTYMFEYPQYVRIDVPENNRFPQYGLYVYSEGRLTERARKMRFNGIPVLFLPGNSGSHKQVRSLASVALRKALDADHDRHFDFYSVDYNEELSGLYGGILQQQTEFAQLCIHRILGLYKPINRWEKSPTSVVVIGHSMGGVIANKLITDLDTNRQINLIITLASPMASPVINFDSAMNNYYLSMKPANNITGSNIYTDKVTVSIGSGVRDILVPSALTYSAHSNVSALTTSIPGVWLSTDHVSIVWCKQLVLAINRYLFSIIDMDNGQITDNKTIVLNQAKRFFKANYSTRLDSEAIEEVSLNSDGFWHEDSRRIYQIDRPQISRLAYLMIRLMSFPQNRFVAIQATGLADDVWIYVCNAQFIHEAQRVCKTATPLSSLTRWSVSTKELGKRKMATVDLHHLIDISSEWTHVVVKMSPTRKPVHLSVDINDHASRSMNVELPYMTSFGKQTIVKETEKDAIYYELTLPGFEMLYQAYLLHLVPTKSCEGKAYVASAEMKVPWAEGHEVSHIFTHLKPSPMELILMKGKANAATKTSTGNVTVTLMLDPQCTFTISISYSFYDTLGQMARHYLTMLIPYLAVIIVMAVRHNVLALSAANGGHCESFHTALCSEQLKPYYVLVFARLGNVMIISVPVLAYIFTSASHNIGSSIIAGGTLLPLPLYVAAMGSAHLIGLYVLAMAILTSQLAHKLILRVLWRGGRIGGAWGERLGALMRRAPPVVAAALVAAVPASCGATALTAGAAFYFFLLSKMYEEYLEDFAYRLMSVLTVKIKQYLRKLFTSKTTHKNASNETTKLLVTCDKSSDDNNDLGESNNLNNEPLLGEETNIREEDKELNKAEDILEEKVIKPSDIEDIKVGNLDASQNRSIDSNQTKASSESKNDGKCREFSELWKFLADSDRVSAMNFHFVLFLLWCFVAAINLPALLSWARNFKHGMVLINDTSYYPGIAMAVCAAVLWQTEEPRKNLKHTEKVGQILYLIAVLIAIVGPVTLFYLNYLLPFVFALVTLHQLLDKEVTIEELSGVSGNIGDDNDSSSSTFPEDTTYQSFKDLKDKIDAAKEDD